MQNVSPRNDKASEEPTAVSPSVQISWGELLDKVTILELKARRLRSAEAAANVVRELTMLQAAAALAGRNSPQLASLKRKLSEVNEALWDIEDKIRAKEAAKAFDSEFVELARGVYLNNDKRAELKRQINRLMRSELVEEKQYTQYRT